MSGHGMSHSPHAQHYLAPHQTGRNSNIFQPPQSPALSSSNDYFSPHRERSRKRARPGSVDWTASTPSATPGQSWIQCPTPSDGAYGSACVGRSGAVNERYTLRDGFDTPGIRAETVGYDPMEDAGWRAKMRDNELASAGRSEGRMLSGPLARERNGIARTRSSPAVPTQAAQGWTSFAFGLVGKVFRFGTGMVFGGFHAGGGRGYDMGRTPTPTRGQTRPRLSRGFTPVPGAWQEDEFMGDFEQDNFDSPALSASRPPNKRRMTDKDSWVMVGTPDLAESSPKRKVSSSSVPRLSTFTPRPTASRASSRRSLAPVSRRQSSYIDSTGSPAFPTKQAQPRTGSVSPRRASFAPMRSRPSSAHKEQSSQAYVSPEAEKFVKRQAKQDRKADKAMSSMSKQLQDLIRQGQEALGTKYAVESGGGGEDDLEVGMDEGYADEEGWR